MVSRRQTVGALLGGIPIWLTASLAGAADSRHKHNSRAGMLLEEPLAGVDHKVVSMDLVEFKPGESGTPHRHPGPVFGYILEGSFRMQFLPGPVRTYSKGQAFYEPAMHVHQICRNLSKTHPASFLAVMIREKGQPEVLPAR
jgi:quercetin dioxygenase-like cupin family protein